MTFWIGRATKVAAVVGVVLAVLAVRVLVASHDELARADALRSGGKLELAIVHYRRAASWYAPGNPYSSDALARLRSVAQEARARGDLTQALLAWRSIRGGIMAARSFYTPHAERLAEANRHIADLMAEQDPPPIDAGKSRDQIRGEHLQLLDDTPRPNPWFSLLILSGLALWVSAAFAFFSRGIDAADRLVPREAARWGTAFVVGFGAFVVGLLLA